MSEGWEPACPGEASVEGEGRASPGVENCSVAGKRGPCFPCSA